MIKQAAVDRRTFLKRSLQASGALVIHFNFNTSALANSQIKQAQDKQVSHANGTIFPNAWLEITPDNQLIFTLDKAEIGQNVITSLTAIIAEELDIDYQQLITRFPTLGKNPSHPTYQPSWGTGGSSSISSLWQPLRHAGAAAKTLFSAAAAQHWDTSIDKLYHKNAVVFLKDSKKTITYAELITLAKNIDTPSYQLKPSTDFTQLGKPLIRYDAKAKVTGTATYGMDIDIPNLKYASLIRAPKLGWQVKTFNAQRAKQATGVLDIVRISNGIAIIAESYWQAHSARNLLEVHWQKTSTSHQYDDQTINTALNHSLNTKGLSARKKGESLTTHAANQDNHSNQQHLTATYSAPLLAHTPMEPMNCSALVTNDQCTVWAPTQRPSLAIATAAKVANLPQSATTLHTGFIGGGFGRRLAQDYVKEVVEIAKQVSYPVKLIWSREEDIQQGIFRPVTKCKLQASLLDKKITHWQSQLAHPGSKPKTATPKNIKQRLKHYLSQAKGMINNDQFTTLMGTRGLAKLSYAIENIDVTAHYSALDLPIGLWRSIDHSYNAFYIESFIDELAYTAEVDPYQFRAQHLQHSPRDLKVLQTVAKLANWHSMNTNQGIALHSCFNSHVAQIAEVAIQGSTIRVEKVYCAVDCGAVIDPEGVKQQIEGAIIYGLSAALYGEINLKDGSVQQSNFHDYRGISMLESPDMIIKIIDNPDTPPGGVGEIGTPCIAPAIANAVFAASKQRIRELPIVKALS